MKDKITLEQVEQFMRMLTGEWLPEHWTPDNVPKMTQREAFTVVYYLQEVLRVLPNHHDQCGVCGELYDSECDGFTIDSTDEPDGWQAEVGVTLEMMAESDAMVCSCECELSFWRAKFPDWRPAWRKTN